MGYPHRYLDGKEIDHLAEWVWSSFHPGKKIDAATLYLAFFPKKIVLEFFEAKSCIYIPLRVM